MSFALSMRANTVAVFACLCAATAAAQDSKRVDVKSLRPPPPAIPLIELRKGVDSVIASPGRTYRAGAPHRFMFGDLRRELWEVPFKVEVLRLDTLGGGLSVQEVSGGKQTLGLRFEGKDGVVYQFRSMVKDARRALPSFVRWTPVAGVMDDQMAAQLPLAALVVAELADAAGVLVAKPRPVIMPDDDRLGDYREAFAGRMGWIEVRPESGKDGKPGFAGSKEILATDDLYVEMIANPRNYVNARAVLRARLVDILVGDWDRHSDQWRWARFEDGNRMRWDPIPRDRDAAFNRRGGVLLDIFAPHYQPQYVSFEARYPDIGRLVWAGQRLDRNFLSGLDREQFMEVAREVSRKLTDAVLRHSVSVLPPPYQPVGDTLLAIMRTRRDNLETAAAEFYALLAREPAVVGTKEADSVVVTTDGRSVRVQMYESRSRERVPRFDRTFFPEETEEIRVYLHDGKDRVEVGADTRIITDGNGDGEVEGSIALPIILRVATGGDNDIVVDRTSGDNLFVYNSAGHDYSQLGVNAFHTNSAYLTQGTVRASLRSWGDRDWGASWITMPSADHEPELGFLLGAKVMRKGNGFGQPGCHSCLSFEGLYAFKAGEWIANVEFERMVAPGGWWWTNHLAIYSGRQTRFYGFGNDIPAAPSEDPFTGLRQDVELGSGVRYEPDSTWTFTAGIALKRLGDIRDGGAIFDALPYGSGRFEQFRVLTSVEMDKRDSKSFPKAGGVLSVTADYNPAWMDLTSDFASIAGVARWYHSFPLPLEPTLHLRAVGERVFGTAPFEDAPSLGGSSTLPGFPRRQFRGEAMVSAGALLRAKALSLNLLSGIDIGVHGVTGAGRVWESTEDSDTWHVAHGYGVWLHLPSMGRTLSVTAAKGNKQRIYLDFGFIF